VASVKNGGRGMWTEGAVESRITDLVGEQGSLSKHQILYALRDAFPREAVVEALVRLRLEGLLRGRSSKLSLCVPGENPPELPGFCLRCAEDVRPVQKSGP